MTKQCMCGAQRTEGEPVYCQTCQTFTHPVYVPKDRVRSGRELMTT